MVRLLLVSRRVHRLVLQLAAIGLVVSGFILGVVSFSNSTELDQFVEVVVSPGDTLWGIALEFSEGKDPRSIVYDIKRFNKLESGFIRVGQVLKVPVYQ